MALTGEIVVADHGYKITLPDGWVRIDLSSDLKALFADELKNDPRFASLTTSLQAQLQQAIATGVTLYAIKPGTATPQFATSLNVLVLPSHGMSLDMLEKVNVAQMQPAALDGKISEGQKTFPAGDAVFLTYMINAGDPLGAVVLHQYIFLNGYWTYTLTITGLPTDKHLADDADAMAQSFAFLGGG
jgi:hypothetical protein